MYLVFTTNWGHNGCGCGCKRFQAAAFRNTLPGNLPVECTTSSVPFQVVDVDYAGPISYKTSSKRKTGNTYILLFVCSLTRAMHLEFLSDQTTEGFIKSFRRFKTRRGRPQKVYSDIGRSYVADFRFTLLHRSFHCLVSSRHAGCLI